MTTDAVSPVRATRSRWPARVSYAAAAWSLLYGLAGLSWAFGAAGFPYGVEHDPDAHWVSLLERARPESTGPVIAVVGLVGAVLAVVMGRIRDAHRTPAAATQTLTTAAWALAATLTVVIPDYRPLLAVVRAPMLLVGAPFGWPEEVSLADYPRLFLPWPVANQLLLYVGGLLWVATAVAFWRRIRNACGRCGRTDPGNDAATRASALRWGRRAVAVAVAVPVFYALTRWAWALDIPFGTSREELHKQARDTPGIWLAGAMLATMGAGGAVLTVGLVRRWGEVYPRWIPFLRGKPVRPRTAIVPATLVAVLVNSAGLMYLRLLILGKFEIDGQTWGLYVPELFWPLWGAALGAAAFAYHLRRRGRCPQCSP